LSGRELDAAAPIGVRRLHHDRVTELRRERRSGRLVSIEAELPGPGIGEEDLVFGNRVPCLPEKAVDIGLDIRDDQGCRPVHREVAIRDVPGRSVRIGQAKEVRRGRIDLAFDAEPGGYPPDQVSLRHRCNWTVGIAKV
jgi:hypothetical protein